MAALFIAGIAPGIGLAQAAAGDDVASWVFDRYVAHTIQVMYVNVARASPEAAGVIAPQVPAMVRFLDRHRQPFVTAFVPVLDVNMTAAETARLASQARANPPNIDEALRVKLEQTDLQFRRDHQSILRAMSYDLNLVIEQAARGTKPSQ